MLRQAAENTGDAVGDGMSTETILAHAIHTGTRERHRLEARTRSQLDAANKR
jgi:chaperonin GroEL (HSP60 family)